MPDKAQVTAQIRFALERLSENNAQHEFEHLCRHFARERICSNILPATGPVQAGGDQGRDFETFRSYLSQSALKERSFIGLISDEPLAFACTIQKSRIPAKVKKDVATIMASGTKVKGVHFFCSRGLDVAKRHELQEWARQEHKIELEIFDGEALAEHLSDADLFWLAERFLQIPVELLPTLAPQQAKDWYGQTLEKWRKESRPPQTFADYSEVRRAARNALGERQFDENGKPLVGFDLPELPFWIEKLDEIAQNNRGQILWRRATYEASVIRLRGFGTLIGQEHKIRLYFALVPQMDDSSDFEDAVVLLTYLFVATKIGALEIESNEIKSWEHALEVRLDEQMRRAKKEERINERCALLSIQGSLAMWRNRHERALNVDGSMSYWKKLVTLAERAPLFPLENFADNLAKFAEFIGSHPEYDSLVTALDDLVSARFGQIKAAEKCVARAKAFDKAGDLTRAMAQFHRAKVDWFTEETLPQALGVMGWLTGAYNKQGLHFAAKYYALAAAFTALHSNDLDIKSGIAPCFMRVAECDFALGAWHGCLETANVASIFYPNFRHDAQADWQNEHGTLHRLFHTLRSLVSVTNILQPVIKREAENFSKEILARCGLGEVWEQLDPEAQKIWSQMTPEQVWKNLSEDLAGVPWSDAGPTRRCEWKAHGVHWHVEWDNNYETTLIAEEFLAALQIFLSDLARQDLCLLRTQVRIKIDVVAPNTSQGYKGFDLQAKPSNGQRELEVRLPSFERFRNGEISREDVSIGALTVASRALSEVSLLPASRFDEILEGLFKGGLQNKLMVAAPYSQCLGEFISREDFEKSNRAAKSPLRSPETFAICENEKLPWFDGPGPTYTPENSRTAIKNRYEKFALPIGLTLNRLRNNPDWKQVVTKFRSEGWKDWHLLSGVFHITMNYRMNLRKILLDPKQERLYTQKVFSLPEPEDAPPVPLVSFSEEEMKMHSQIYMISTLQNWGLEIHQLTPDFPAIEEFLARRYQFWTDDIEHADPFSFA